MLGEAYFPSFAPLLVAAQVHAQHTGFRFRRSPPSEAEIQNGQAVEQDPHGLSFEEKKKLFEGVGESPPVPQPATPLVAGKSPVPQATGEIDVKIVDAWCTKLQAAAEAVENGHATGEQASLIAELRKARDIVGAESVRNAMISTCKELALFPPPPMAKAFEIDEEDCAYEDCTAPFPLIAQRLYNDTEQRLSYSKCEGRAQQRILLLTALFITDFAEDACVMAPQLSETAQSMLSDFAASVADWTSGGSVPSDSWQGVQTVLAEGFALFATDVVRTRGVLATLLAEARTVFGPEDLKTRALRASSVAHMKAMQAQEPLRKRFRKNIGPEDLKTRALRASSEAHMKAMEAQQPLRARISKNAAIVKHDLDKKWVDVIASPRQSSLPTLLEARFSRKTCN